MSVALAAGRGSAVATLGVAAWIGAALLTAAVVAPTAFAVLPTRALAGALVARILPPLFLAGLVFNALAAASAWRDGGRFSATRVGLSTLAAVACAMAQLVVARRIEALRASIGPNLEVLAAADPRRVAFGQLHALSVATLGLAMLAAVVAVALSVSAASRDRAGRGAASNSVPGRP